MIQTLLRTPRPPGSGSIHPARSAMPSTATVAGRLMPAAYATPSDCATVVTEPIGPSGGDSHYVVRRIGVSLLQPPELSVAQRSGGLVYQHSESGHSVLRIAKADRKSGV